MDKNYREILYKMNCLASDLDSLYHQAALTLGMSDSVMFVLYLVYENGGSCLLNTIRKEASLNKQTLNSSIRKLEREEIIYLEQVGGRAKNVCLTEKGKEYVNKTIVRLFNAECAVLNGWTEEDIYKYMELMEKYNNDFRDQLVKMQGE